MSEGKISSQKLEKKLFHTLYGRSNSNSTREIFLDTGNLSNSISYLEKRIARESKLNYFINNILYGNPLSDNSNSTNISVGKYAELEILEISFNKRYEYINPIKSIDESLSNTYHLLKEYQTKRLNSPIEENEKYTSLINSCYSDFSKMKLEQEKLLNDFRKIEQDYYSKRDEVIGLIEEQKLIQNKIEIANLKLNLFKRFESIILRK